MRRRMRRVAELWPVAQAERQELAGTGTLHLAPEYHAQGRHHARVRQDGFVRHQSSLADLALQHTCAAERASSSRNQLVGGS